MKTRKSQIHKPKHQPKTGRKVDPRYAAARPWDWKVCLDCQELISERCPHCGGTRFSSSPRQIISTGLRIHGYPPSLHQG